MSFRKSVRLWVTVDSHLRSWLLHFLFLVQIMSLLTQQQIHQHCGRGPCFKVPNKCMLLSWAFWLQKKGLVASAVSSSDTHHYYWSRGRIHMGAFWILPVTLTEHFFFFWLALRWFLCLYKIILIVSSIIQRLTGCACLPARFLSKLFIPIYFVSTKSEIMG